MVYPLIQRIGVIWDEDYDIRVIRALEAVYMNNLLAPVVFVGERKAALTIAIRDDTQIGATNPQPWIEAVERVLDDNWSVEIVHMGDLLQAQMIHDHRTSVVETYLANIRDLWQLGMHTHSSQQYAGNTPSSTCVDFNDKT